jgi:Na+/alanine symporter
MAIPNIIGVYLLAGPLRTELRSYLAWRRGQQWQEHQ